MIKFISQTLLQYKHNSFINTIIKKTGVIIDEDKLSDEQLENVIGGMSDKVFDLWRAEYLNESR
jgi:hypothetical protein